MVDDLETVCSFLKWIQIPDMLIHLHTVRPIEYHLVIKGQKFASILVCVKMIAPQNFFPAFDFSAV